MKNNKKDCIIELETCKDFGQMELSDIQIGKGSQSLFSLRQMVENGRPVVAIIMPPGLKFEASSIETFSDSMKRLSEMRPAIVVFGGK